MLPTTSTLPISDEALHEAIAHYRAHGWARLGQVLDDAELSRLRERADAIMLGQITHEGMFFQTDAETGNYDDLPRGKGYFQGPSLKYRKIEKLERDPIFRGLIECALYGRIAHTVIGPDISLSRAVLFTKAATGGTHLPWHQDGGTFWGLSRDPVLQIWTALDDAPEESGCVELVPQSHLHGLATPLGGVIPDEVVARNPLVPAKLRVPARAGEAMLLHNHTWHRSGTNSTGRPRRALTVCYMDAATTCTRRRSPRQFLRLFQAP